MAALVSQLASIFQETTYLSAVVVGLSILYLLQLYFKYKDFPPGPWGLPFVGYAPFMGEDTLTFFTKLRDKYGDICSINQGVATVVVLNTLEGIKEVFVKQADNFAGVSSTLYIFKAYLGEGTNVFLSEGDITKEQKKFLLNTLRDFGFGKLKLEASIQAEAEVNVFLSEGDITKEQKKFLLNTLRDFGFGKLKLEASIQAEAEQGLHILRALEGQPCDLIKSRFMARMSCNIIANLVFGQRFDSEDPRLAELLDSMDNVSTAFSQTSGVESYAILRYLPAKWTGMDKIQEARKIMFDFMTEMVKEHEKTYDPNNLRDLVDVYHKAVLEKKAIAGKEIPPYTEEMLVGNMVTLCQAGTDDAVVLLAWQLMAAAMYPQAQKKVQEELDRFIGRQRLPSWIDKNNLPYAEAFSLEVQRVGAPFPLTVLHTSTVETTVMGYRLPVRTEVMGNTWLLYRDEKIWGDPDNFRPERFIGEDGKINRLRDNLLTFGIGRKSCLGESLAKMETFIYFLSIIQNFTMTLPPDNDANDQRPSPDIRRLTTCKLCAIPRD